MNASNSVSTTVLSPSMDYLPPPDPKAVEQAMLIGDISQMTDAQRIAYYVAVCRSVGLNPLTKPFQALKGDDGKMSLYADKGCAEQLRKLHRVSIKVLSREFLDDLYIVTVVASTPDGREEEAQGVVPISKPKGHWKEYEYRGQPRRRFEPEIDSAGHEMTVPLSAAERANAVKRAETQAKRRATLGICGLGLPDWDGEPTSPAHPMALDLQAPPALEAEKTLDEHIADLYGDPTPPVREDDATWLARIEAAILAQGQQVEPWMKWAEGRFHKDRTTFTVEDYTTFLDKVKAAPEILRRRQETLAHAEAQETPETVPPPVDVPGGDATPEGSQEPSGHVGAPDLFKQEEEQADEYGE